MEERTAAPRDYKLIEEIRAGNSINYFRSSTGNEDHLVDGEQIEANGEFTWRTSGTKREYHMNSNGKGYWTETPEAGLIKGAVINVSETDIEKLKNAKGVTVTLEEDNGKIVVAKDAIQIDSMEGNTGTGVNSIEFQSDSVEEIR